VGRYGVRGRVPLVGVGVYFCLVEVGGVDLEDVSK